MIDFISGFGCAFILIIVVLIVYVLKKDCRDNLQIYPVATPAFIGGIPVATEIKKNEHDCRYP